MGSRDAMNTEPVSSLLFSPRQLMIHPLIQPVNFLRFALPGVSVRRKKHLTEWLPLFVWHNRLSC